MTHEHAGNYSAKHPPGSRPDPRIAASLKAEARDGQITCSAAHDIADDLEVLPAQVGKAADLLEYRITECQLGLFGHNPEKKIAKPLEQVPEKLKEQIFRRTTDGKISCAACWGIAHVLGLDKLTVGNACETLGVKVVRCQLGAF